MISHSILLGKLLSLGFSDQILRWIKAFLSYRCMCGSIGGCDSREVPVTSGVPQVSVLGPLLFLIYVNSLGAGFNCPWYAFAEDFKLYAVHSKSTDLDNLLQADLDQLVTISLSWNLRLNPTKFVVMRFGERDSRVVQGVGSGYGVLGEEL